MATKPPPKRPPTPPAQKGQPSRPPSRTLPTAPAKTFKVQAWTNEGQGIKCVGYGASGSGKTTLFSMMPGAVFIGVDDGGRMLRHPKTEQPIQHVAGITSFADVRDALHQHDLWKPGASCIIDTLTALENLAEPYMFDTIKTEKGKTAENIEDYGYGKGYTHLFDTMRMILQDLDALVRRGVNVGLICQAMAVKKANPGGTDYLYDGPKLSHPSSEKNSVRLHVCEWADHVFCIDYQDKTVDAAPKDRIGKAQGNTVRCVYTHPEPHFFAKTRTLAEPVISFETPADDSLWQFLFGD